MNNNSIEFQLENDPLISDLMKRYNLWEFKSSVFIEIYKNLLWLWYHQKEIHDYYDLWDDYYDFIKKFI